MKTLTRGLCALGLPLLFAVEVAACSSSQASTSPADAGAVDAGADDAAPQADAGTSFEGVYPAPHAPLPLVQGTTIVASPKVVTISFAGDGMQPRLEAFADALGSSDWWRATTSEYCDNGDAGPCIGPLSVLAHVTVTAPPPATLDYTAVPTYLQSLITDRVVPAPIDGVVYAFLFPATVSLGSPGFQQCHDFDGYHDITTVTPPAPQLADGGDEAGDGGLDAGPPGGPMAVPYAVLARCSSSEAESTLATAHELLEIATDPDGVSGFNIQEPAWNAFFYPEVGDLCDFEPSQALGAGFSVQAGWSNAAARAGKNPCVPSAKGEPYFNAAPEKNTVTLAVGATTTLAVMPFSEAATGDWALDAFDMATFYGGATSVDASVDLSQVHNGLPVTLTLTLQKKPTQLPNGMTGAVVVLSSTMGARKHYWPIFVKAK